VTFHSSPPFRVRFLSGLLGIAFCDAENVFWKFSRIGSYSPPLWVLGFCNPDIVRDSPSVRCAFLSFPDDGLWRTIVSFLSRVCGFFQLASPWESCRQTRFFSFYSFFPPAAYSVDTLGCLGWSGTTCIFQEVDCAQPQVR